MVTRLIFYASPSTFSSSFSEVVFTIAVDFLVWPVAGDPRIKEPRATNTFEALFVVNLILGEYLEANLRLKFVEQMILILT